VNAILGWLTDAFDVGVEWVGNAAAFVLAAVLLAIPFVAATALFFCGLHVLAWLVG